MSSDNLFAVRPVYRIRQFLAALQPKISQEDYDLAFDELGLSLFPLFTAMSPYDQRHCMKVYRILHNH